MPYNQDLFTVILFIGLLALIYYLANKHLNLNLRENFASVLEPFKSNLLMNIFVLLGLLLFRAFLSTNIQLLIDYYWLDKGVTILILIMLYRVISIFLDLLEASYNQSKYALKRPLRPLVQAVKIVLLIIVFFGILAVVLDKDPLIVMGSVSTFAAFISFIFKDILLGFFAGIQLTSTETIQIGDFISVPELNISGTIDSIGLTTLKLIASNQTHITVSTYSLIQYPVINYRHLSEAPGRQYINRFNFKFNNQLDLRSLETSIRNYIENSNEVNHDKLESIQFEAGPMNNLTLVVTLFSNYSGYVEFDSFSTRLSLEILQIMASHECF